MRALALIALVALALAGPAAAAKAKDEKHCEVCIKVVDGIREAMDAKDAKKPAKVEKGIATFCEQEGLDQRQKKICYYFDPMKRTVAQPFSLGMPAVKVCERLSKDNPEICEVKYPMKVSADTDVTKLRVKQLKKLLRDRGVECTGCLEKADFVKRVQETMHLEV